MQTFKKALDTPIDYSWCKSFIKEEILVFDIETTGLSADTSYLYLICCGYFEDNHDFIIQWFAEDYHEEINLLNAFFEFASHYKLLVHYNGNTFDVPYINKKCRQYGLSYNFDNLQHLDLYRRIFPYKSVLGLSSIRQKNIEAFLNINREDKADGGMLIDVYMQYLARKRYEALLIANNSYDELKLPYGSGLASITNASSLELQHLLLLHNFEDVLGLMRCLIIIPLLDVLDGTETCSFKAIINGKYLEISCTIPYASGVNCVYNGDLFKLKCTSDSLILTVDILSAELKHYFPGYKDYYYLPGEDEAIHKSVAQFVDKDRKCKATASTCYVRKESLFLPQRGLCILPAYSYLPNDKIKFFELNDDFLESQDKINAYAVHLLQNVVAQHKKTPKY